MPELSFLHLSDIHFRHQGSQFDLDKDLRNELEIDLKVVMKEICLIDGILISGDIAFSANESEYEEANKWLSTVCKITESNEANVWTVPGNHDIDWNAENIVLESLRKEILSFKNNNDYLIDYKLNDYLEDISAKEIIFKPLHSYNKFAIKFGCQSTPERISWDYDFKLNDNSTLRIRGMNSVLFSTLKDDDAGNKLLIGSSQATLTRNDGVCYLTMCHHPPSWLRDIDSIEDTWNKRSSIQIFGHKHSQKLNKIDNFLRISAGAVHPSRREPNWLPRYNIISISVINKSKDRYLQIKVRPRVWDKEEAKFKPDFTPEGEPERIFDFSIGEWKDTQPFKSKAEKKEIEPKKEREKMFDPERDLAYKFFQLPYTEILEIAIKLKLIENSDSELEGVEQKKNFLRRAKEKKMYAKLWDCLKEKTKFEYQQNPFNYV